jgi:hypothetical protein
MIVKGVGGTLLWNFPPKQVQSNFSKATQTIKAKRALKQLLHLPFCVFRSLRKWEKFY